MASNPLFGILWLILLSFLAWPVAALCAGIWVVLMVSLHVGRVHTYILKTMSHNHYLCSYIISCYSQYLINSLLRHAAVVLQILTKLWRTSRRGQRSAAMQSKTAALRALLQTKRSYQLWPKQGFVCILVDSMWIVKYFVQWEERWSTTLILTTTLSNNLCEDGPSISTWGWKI